MRLPKHNLRTKRSAKGLCKAILSEFTREQGGWVKVSLGNNFLCGKSSQNSPKPVLICWSTIPCEFCLYTHCVSYYDLSVLSMSVMGFKKKKFGWGKVGGVRSIQFLLDFLTLQSPQEDKKVVLFTCVRGRRVVTLR